MAGGSIGMLKFAVARRNQRLLLIVHTSKWKHVAHARRLGSMGRKGDIYLGSWSVRVIQKTWLYAFHFLERTILLLNSFVIGPL